MHWDHCVWWFGIHGEINGGWFIHSKEEFTPKKKSVFSCSHYLLTIYLLIYSFIYSFIHWFIFNSCKFFSPTKTILEPLSKNTKRVSTVHLLFIKFAVPRFHIHLTKNKSSLHFFDIKKKNNIYILNVFSHCVTSLINKVLERHGCKYSSWLSTTTWWKISGPPTRTEWIVVQLKDVFFVSVCCSCISVLVFCCIRLY